MAGKKDFTQVAHAVFQQAVGQTEKLPKQTAKQHVERANLSMRMGMRRFTRLTNALKLQNHMHAVSFYFMVYNFVKIHGSLRVTPAMAAGMTDTLWRWKTS